MGEGEGDLRSKWSHRGGRFSAGPSRFHPTGRPLRREDRRSEAVGTLEEPRVNESHYHLSIEPIVYIQANDLSFCAGNVVKYVSRYKQKNGAEDIRKAIRYCEFILKHEYGVEP